MAANFCQPRSNALRCQASCLAFTINAGARLQGFELAQLLFQGAFQEHDAEHSPREPRCKRRKRPVRGSGFQWTARYDVLGRRIESTFNGKTATFYWDGDRLVAEVRPDGQLRVYVYADHLALVPLMFVDYANIHADPKAGKRYFVFATHLGAPELIEDDAGNAVWRARYEAYGTAHIEMGTDVHQPLRWPGHYYDEATRLHYVRFRYYSPELGQFLEPDPQGVQGGWNLHAYGQANPVKYVDIRGLNECPEREGPNKKKKGNPDEEDAHGSPAVDEKAAKPPRRSL